MRVDSYTKTILTLIAILLAIIAVRPMVEPPVAKAQTNLWSEAKFAVGPTGPWILINDTSRGGAFLYKYDTGTLKPNVWYSSNPRDKWEPRN
jgi:hypothetical protein